MSPSWRTVAEALPGLGWLGERAGGTAWLADLDRRVAACAEAWSLTVGEAYGSSTVSLAVAVRGADGDPAVLKLQFPDRESAREAEALHRWDGGGAVRLLSHDPELGALLLERCEPGSPLSEAPPDRSISVMAGLVRRLAVPASAPFTTLCEEAAHWAAGLPGRFERAGRPFDRAMLDEALVVLADQSEDQGPQVLIHQDLHGGNVLAARREPWLAIDPKPIVGELEFAVAPIVRSTELGGARGALASPRPPRRRARPRRRAGAGGPSPRRSPGVSRAPGCWIGTRRWPSGCGRADARHRDPHHAFLGHGPHAPAPPNARGDAVGARGRLRRNTP